MLLVLAAVSAECMVAWTGRVVCGCRTWVIGIVHPPVLLVRWCSPRHNGEVWGAP